ncbi:MAG: hypothetical protein ABSH35_19610 [Isosphaeraceae bacterium]|jgi:hypothetical protein
MQKSNKKLPEDAPTAFAGTPWTWTIYERLLRDCRTFPVPIYAGRALQLRNRNQRYDTLDQMWRLLQDEANREFEDDIMGLNLAAWYIESANERQVAEATLIRLLKPRLNKKQEGEATWPLRSPDIAGVPFLTFNPGDRKELERDTKQKWTCGVDNRPGVYLWYVESDIGMLELVARRGRFDPPTRTPPDRPDLAFLAVIEDLSWPPSDRDRSDLEFQKWLTRGGVRPSSKLT